MANKPRWTEHRSDGVLTVKVRKWAFLSACLTKYVQSITNYIYRGQADARWPLLSTLDRALQGTHARLRPRIEAEHLKHFKLAVRGRRGPHPATYSNENEWWALGQHNGLASPLLDWTNSPYVAAYFAFISRDVDTVRERCVFALQAQLVEDFCAGKCEIFGITEPIVPPGGQPLPPDECIERFVPLSDENARLVSQGGLFTRGPAGVDYESWVRHHFKGVTKGLMVKFILPTRERTECLQSLNRMNINHLTLFPDVFGASRHCNHLLTIPDY
jgi:hypothetical protein